MAKRFTDTNKYKKPFIRGLQGPYKLLWDFIYHDCDHAGIWIVDFEIAQIYLGIDMPVNREDALRFFNDGEQRIQEFDKGKKWWVKPFITFQYGELNPENRAHKSVIDILENKGLIRSLQGRKDVVKDKDMVKDKEKERKKRKNFIKPTIQQIADYIREKGYKVDPKAWFNHYESNGWMVGRNKMVDWKAAVRTWTKNNFQQTPQSVQKSVDDAFDQKSAESDRKMREGKEAWAKENRERLNA